MLKVNGVRKTHGLKNLSSNSKDKIPTTYKITATSRIYEYVFFLLDLLAVMYIPLSGKGRQMDTFLVSYISDFKARDFLRFSVSKKDNVYQNVITILRRATKIVLIVFLYFVIAHTS